MIAPGRTVKPLVRIPKDANDCWPWQGATNGKDVPVKCINGTNVSARRWLWQTLFGPLPREFEVTTSCGNAGCMSPVHMRAVTRAELLQAQSGLTPADVIEIKRLAIQGGVPHDLLAKRYDVHHSTINKITKGTRWKIKEARAA